MLPPILAGLDGLSPAQNALIEQFPVNPDALAAAAGQSQASMPDRIPMAKALATIEGAQAPPRRKTPES